jgi:K+-sensing histidine kinase KdpD
MVNVLLDTADVTNGLAGLNCREDDLIGLFSETHDVFKSTTQARNINLELDADCASCFMQIDEQRFSHAIRQLLSEAIRQARPYGTILVRFSNRPHAVSISISHLIYRETLQPHENLEPVSDGSVCAHFVTHSPEDGNECRIDTDLSIAKAIVELHGGVFKLIGAGTNGLQAELCLHDNLPNPYRAFPASPLLAASPKPLLPPPVLRASPPAAVPATSLHKCRPAQSDRRDGRALQFRRD